MQGTPSDAGPAILEQRRLLRQRAVEKCDAVFGVDRRGNPQAALDGHSPAEDLTERSSPEYRARNVTNFSITGW
jgi:hypothetical protein